MTEPLYVKLPYGAVTTLGLLGAGVIIVALGVALLALIGV
jgi:hypothetical protein